MGAATSGANNCPPSTLKLHKFADAEAVLAAWQAGERPDDVMQAIRAGHVVCGAQLPPTPTLTLTLTLTLSLT